MRRANYRLYLLCMMYTYLPDRLAVSSNVADTQYGVVCAFMASQGF